MDRLLPLVFPLCLCILAALWFAGPTAVQAAIESVGLRQVVYVSLGSILALWIVLTFNKRREGTIGDQTRHVRTVEDAITNLNSPYPEIVEYAATILAGELQEREHIHRRSLWRAMHMFAIAGVLVLLCMVVSGSLFIDFVGGIL